jgi:nicotinamide riboside transporter PnuC
LSESWKDTKGIAGRLMMVTVLIGGSQIFIGFIFGLVGDTSTLLFIVTEILYGLISTSLMIFMSVTYFRLYTEDRTEQEAQLESEI